MARAFWTEEKVDILKKLINQGLSFANIGSQIGCSRNAAIGKALRLGINTKFAPGAGRKTKEEKGFIAPPRRPKLVLVPPEAKKPPSEALSPEPEPVYVPVRTLPSGRQRVMLPPSLKHDDAFEARIYAITNKTSGRDIENIPRDRQCKYIYGDPKHPESYWCRMDVRAGSHYCERHSRLMYQPRAIGGHFRLPK